MKNIILFIVTVMLMMGCGGKKSPRKENLQTIVPENRLADEQTGQDQAPGNDNFRIEYFKNNGNVRFYDSKGVEKLSCNTNTENIPFSLKPIVWENSGKIEYSSVSVNIDGDIKPDLITFQSADGEKLKCRIVPKNVSLLSEGKSVSKMTYNIDLKPNFLQNKTDSLLNFLSTRQLDKITLEDTRDHKSTVQGVSNAKFFIEFFKSLENFRIDKE
ncbi:MAG TPA: hypothetical protein VN249_02660 [Prolixibacteraceae bacterium]|nr:hypothetical protein [Prolixibacteraceae bacterium]